MKKHPKIKDKKVLNLDLVKAQYNPNRFKQWKSLYPLNDNDFLNMRYSPHIRFLEKYECGQLKNIESTPYYKMHKLYGKNKIWIENKIEKFLNIYEELKKEFILKENISILEEPQYSNPYNHGYEIYEGHHRFSCALFLQIKEIEFDIISLPK